MLSRICFRTFRLCLLLALALLLPQMLFGQAQVLGRILGTIRVGSGDFPPRLIMVELRLRGAPIVTAYADGQGAFAFDNLQANSYRIVINDEAYYPVDERADVNPSVLQTTTLHIVLRAREAKKHDDIGARASGSNPYLVDLADYDKRFPKKALKEYQRGLDAERKGKQEEAIAHYEDALKIAPEYYPAHNNLGSLYLGKTDFKAAEAQFRETVRLDSNEGQAYFNLANVLMLTGRYSESEAALAAGLQRRPDSAFGHFLYGCVFERGGKFDDAEKHLRQALQLDTAMWQAHLQLVNLYLQRSQPQEAIAELQVFLRDFPSLPATPKAKAILEKLQSKNNAPHP